MEDGMRNRNPHRATLAAWVKDNLDVLGLEITAGHAGKTAWINVNLPPVEIVTSSHGGDVVVTVLSAGVEAEGCTLEAALASLTVALSDA